jgi:CRP-like cAMP-binding protein
MTADECKRLESKVDLLIRLLAMNSIRGMAKVGAIVFLHRVGMDRRDIADLCGTTPEAVSVRVSEARRRGKGVASAES